MSLKEYDDLWKEVQENGHYRSMEVVHPHQNKRPIIRIWDITSTSEFEERQNTISLNKEWIGENTVYWRRLIRVKVYHCFECRTYPFGYEQVKLKVRLISYTKQHLVLLRTKLWYQEHVRQTSEAEWAELAAHTYAYIHPDNSYLSDWTICSLHDCKDRWYCKFDHNDLCYNLPVYVSSGLDTQSWLEALITLKRKPRFVIFNIWIWFTFTSFVALLTYQTSPTEDLADRLAIAVGIIFVQMQLKIQSAVKTPRMPFTTALDFQMWISVLLVASQAVTQVLSVAKFIREELEEDLQKLREKEMKELNETLFQANLAIVVVVNILTYGIAKCFQYEKRKTIEKDVKSFFSFKKYELNVQPPSVKLAGYYKGQALRITNQELINRIGREKTEYGFFERKCKCCMFFKY